MRNDYTYRIGSQKESEEVQLTISGFELFGDVDQKIRKTVMNSLDKALDAIKNQLANKGINVTFNKV